MSELGAAFSEALMAVLREEREARRRTVREIAEAAGVFPGTLLRYLNNHREMPISVYYSVARALDADPVVLFTRAQRLVDERASARTELRFDQDRPRPTPAEVGRRIALLVDVLARGRGSRHGFIEISPHLLERGIRFTEREWALLLEGRASSAPSDESLRVIAEVLGAEPAFLLGAEGDSDVVRVESQLQFLREVQSGRVSGISARAVTDVTPETLRAMTEQLRQEGPDQK